LTSPDWRDVTIDPEIVDQLGAALSDAGYRVDDAEIVRLYIDHAVAAFREGWDGLDEGPDGARRVLFDDDIFPLFIFHAYTVSQTLYDFGVLEQTVHIYRVTIIRDEALGVEDPDDPTPDR
jgi:hypothetical protein